MLAGCAGASDMFQSDLLSKDAEWFSRSGRLFIKNVSIETPPLTPDKPVTSDDLVSAEGFCPGMTAALGHTECDVVRGIGPPDNVSLSNNPRGDRVAVVNYSRGQRAGIYTFTAGRLTSIERGSDPVVEPKAAKPKKKKPAAT
jgi:hypothetical protein